MRSTAGQSPNRSAKAPPTLEIGFGQP
jgi:hypothetical protein